MNNIYFELSPPDGDCCRRAMEVGVVKKVLVERELRGGGGSRRKQQEAIEVEVAKEVLVERELRGE